MTVVNELWMPQADMKRIICHWTAGAYEASNADILHYHILVEGDGTLVRGTCSIPDNESTRDGVYAAHTLGTNTGSIGVAVCCMADATRSDPGRFPMTERQWLRMAEVAAELCKRYRIEVTPTTVLGHGEVERNLGIKQRGKWDPMMLPWEPDLPAKEVGDRFRRLVQTFVDGQGYGPGAPS